MIYQDFLQFITKICSSFLLSLLSFDITIYDLGSVQYGHSVVSDSLWPHGLQHARLPCLSPTPRAYSNSCPSHQWCHPTISSSVVPFSSSLQSFPASGSLQISQFFVSGGWSRSFSFSISPSKEYSWLVSLSTDWFDLLAVQRTLKSLLQHHSSKASILRHSAFFMIQWILAIGSLVPLPFLNPACISGSFQFTYCWRLAWRIPSITLLAREMSTIVQ